MQGIRVTEVRVTAASDDDEKLLGYCSVTLNNSFVIRDVKIIQGEGSPFIAMPSRKITDKCLHCRSKNHLRAKFCNECGKKLPPNRAATDAQGRFKLHFDLVHPIRSQVRDYIQRKVIEAYHAQISRADSEPAAPHDE